MTNGGCKTDNERKAEMEKHSASFVAMVELVRHLARIAAQYDYEAMQKAADERKRKLNSDWNDKQ